jgi:hypothetical protein
MNAIHLHADRCISAVPDETFKYLILLILLVFRNEPTPEALAVLTCYPRRSLPNGSYLAVEHKQKFIIPSCGLERRIVHSLTLPVVVGNAEVGTSPRALKSLV